MSKEYWTGSNQTIRLGQRLAAGGEGAVYDLIGKPDVVAKIYHRQLSIHHSRKLEAMERIANPSLQKIAAWPKEILFESRVGPNNIVGFIMPKVVGQKPLHQLYTPVDRKQFFPNISWAFLVHAARNLSTAVHNAHICNVIIGDLNSSNILVGTNATITLIDCDSFQVSENGTTFPCEVGMPLFMPPELRGKNLKEVVRTESHDSYSLGILIFHLLFLGRHPFAGVPLVREEYPIERAMAENLFVYANNPQSRILSPPPNPIPLSVLPAYLSSLFDRAFSRRSSSSDSLPRPSEWRDALEQLGKELKQCQVNPIHRFPSSQMVCPWCQIERNLHVVLFAAVDVSKQLVQIPESTFSLKVFLEKLTSINLPPAESPSDFLSTNSLPAQSHSVNVDTIRRLRAQALRVAVGILLFNGLFEVFIFECFRIMIPTTAYLLFFVTCMAVFLFQTSKQLRLERRERKKDFLEKKQRWEEKWNDWNNDDGVKMFHDQKRTIQIKANEYESLKKSYDGKQEYLRNHLKENQLQEYLRSYSVRDALCPSVLKKNLDTLIAYGIETAADITWDAVFSTPGFGGTRTTQMVEWRKKIERKFRFDPNLGVPKAYLQILDMEFLPKIRRFELELEAELKSHSDILNKIVARRKRLKPQLEALMRELKQAEVSVPPSFWRLFS